MPIYDCHCLTCDRRWERLSRVDDRLAPCACGGAIELELTPAKHYGFAAYFDDGLGADVTSLGQRHQLMRRHHLDYKDHPSKGDLSARRDKIEARKREAGC